MEVQERSSLCQYNYFVLYYVLHYKHNEATLDSQKVSFEDFNLPPTPQPTICGYTPNVGTF